MGFTGAAGALLVVALCLTAKAHTQTELRPSDNGPGAAYYERLCVTCHGRDGLGVEGEGPPLAQSPWVSGPEARLIRIVMHGIRGRIQVGDQIHDREMPGFGSRLSDRDLALLLSFVRNRWGRSTAPVTPENVRRVRVAAGNRTRYWTVEELLKTPEE
jgi:mono/diheme cytochrome c family protein